MEEKMNETVLRIYNKVRFLRNPRVKTCGKTLISPRTEVSVQGMLYIGNGVITERGSLLGSRGGAELCLGSKVYINRNVCIVAKELIRIGNHVDIGPNVCIYDHDHSDKSKTGFVTAPIVIGDNVWIGAGCVILKGVTIGENSIIAAGSVITRNIPSNSVVYQKRTSTIVSQ